MASNSVGGGVGVRHARQVIAWGACPASRASRRPCMLNAGGPQTRTWTSAAGGGKKASRWRTSRRPRAISSLGVPGGRARRCAGNEQGTGVGPAPSPGIGVGFEGALKRRKMCRKKKQLKPKSEYKSKFFSIEINKI